MSFDRFVIYHEKSKILFQLRNESRNFRSLPIPGIEDLTPLHTVYTVFDREQNFSSLKKF